MPTSATGTSASSPHRAPRRLSRGFTLLEMLVVVFIIGLVAAGAILAFTGDQGDSELEKEAGRLDALFDYAREQAELQTRDYGFTMTARDYTFVVFDILANEWRPVAEDDALRERALPDGLTPEMVVEGRRIVLETRKPEVTDHKPQVVIFANGDVSSFEVTLRRDGGRDRARLYTDDDNLVQLLLPGEEEPRNPPVRALGAR